MSDNINWQSAFSDDSLDGALDKTKNAKSKFDEVADKVSEHLGDDDTAEQENPGAEATQELSQPDSPPPAAPAATPSVVVEPADPSASPPPPAAPVPKPAPAPSPPQTAPAQPAYTPPPAAPAQNNGGSDDDDGGGGLPLRKIFGALTAIVPILIAGFFFLREDPVGSVCDEARDRLEQSAAGGVIDESQFPEICQEGDLGDDETTETATSGDDDGSEEAADEGDATDDTDETVDEGGEDEETEPEEPDAPPQPNLSVTNNASHPEGDLIAAQTYGLLVDAVNDGGAESAWPALGPAITTNNTAAAWASGQQTSTLIDYTIESITDVSSTEREARVTFRSEQDANFGPNGQTCTDWDITHRLVLNADPAGPTWLINSSSQNPGSPADCSATPAPAVNTCGASEVPQDAVVEVVGIPTNDPDGGLNFRQEADPSSTKLATFNNGTKFATTGGCAVRPSGAVWWQVSGQGITAWANSDFLAGV